MTLSRADISGTRPTKRAVKNHRLIRVELPKVVVDALEVLPHPKAALRTVNCSFPRECEFEEPRQGSRPKSCRCVRACKCRAGPHRFRHTLASELLGKGGTYEEVAAILGDSPATIRRNYAKWTEEYQSRQDSLIRRIHDTDLAQAEGQASN